MIRLTEHFTLQELTVTHTGMANVPNAQVINNLKQLAQQLEHVRLILCIKARRDVPVIVTSGYRCPEVNAFVGGSKTSAHLKGLAADFVAPQFGTPKQIAIAIKDSALEFDQLIYQNICVHLSIDEPMRQLVLTKVAGDPICRQGII